MNTSLNPVFVTSILTQRRGIAMTFSGIGQVITVLYAMGPGHHQMEWFLSIMSAVYVVRLLYKCVALHIQAVPLPSVRPCQTQQKK